jgi:hypothetical protein
MVEVKLANGKHSVDYADRFVWGLRFESSITHWRLAENQSGTVEDYRPQTVHLRKWEELSVSEQMDFVSFIGAYAARTIYNKTIEIATRENKG